MPSDAERLSDADDCHDADPQRAAGLLRDIDAATLPADSLPLYAFLLNHVLGEKLGRWPDAHALQQRLSASAGATPVLWRHAAVAAHLAGDGPAAAAATAALADAGAVGLEQAGELVQLAGAALQTAGADAAQAAERVLRVLSLLEAAHWRSGSALDAAAAANCNNIAAALSERAPAELRGGDMRRALMGAALASQRLWQRAGNWVNHERACYGVAVAAAACSDAQAARAAAQQGLALLDTHDGAGEQMVDRAFLELELAHAAGCLGDADAAQAARARADTLAARFDDASLRDWYAQRLARQQQLREPQRV